MRVIVCDTYEEMSKEAAKIMAAQVHMKPDCVLGLATGSTPVGAYKELIAMYNNKEIDFKDVTTFHHNSADPFSSSTFTLK